MKLISHSLILMGYLFAQVATGATKTQVDIVFSHFQIPAGEEILAGVRLEMPEGWHTYWKNSGESGAPTSIEWELPAGFEPGEIRWPLPEKYTELGLTTYIYHHQAILLVPIRIASSVEPGEYAIRAKVSWLECEKVCVPGSGDVAGTVKVGASPVLSTANDVLMEALKKAPIESGSSLNIQAAWENPIDEENRSFVIHAPATLFDSDYEFFPYSHPDADVLGDTMVRSGSDLVSIQKKVFKYDGEWPSVLEGVIAGKVGGQTQGYEVRLDLSGESTLASIGSGGSPMGSGANSGRPRGLGLMLVFGFIGGLILNIMPCVLPVISLKILGFVQQSHDSPSRSRSLGLLYGAGVLASFIALALVAIAVKQAGGAANWGMAFQNPIFRVIITVVITLVALNLFGLFEINLGGKTMSTAGQLASKDGMAGAFMNGILASVLATPCTAPFLSVAMTFAFTQPSHIILAMFIMVGLGLAFPFVALCWQPAWLKFMPKPGAWMNHFKVAMGFPMMATAVWLYSIAAPRMGRGGVLWFGVFLVLLAFCAWIYGTFIQQSPRRRPLAWLTILCVLTFNYTYILEKELHWRSPINPSASSTSLKSSPDGIPWRPWSPEAVQEALAEGHPVLVDFTADYCWNCKLNKKTSLEIESTRTRLKEIDAVAFLADYTDPNPLMTEVLNTYDRPGVPLVLVYSPEDPGHPIVLPEILTPSIVHEALDKVAKPRLSTTLSKDAALF